MGMRAIPKPASARPMKSAAYPPAAADTSAPAAMIARQTYSSGRFPYMSARRESVGTLIAPIKRVMVTSQVAASAETSSSRGKMGSSGMTRVWLSEAASPLRLSVPLTSHVGRRWRAPPATSGPDAGS
ncbi:hypothetical protein GCM10022383_26110 [Microbacterium soli]|uniref:Uncharacterized protein n=1 Tax=Microbacterium soli TaxID=446075 RepID=A0ABP7NIT7_9MICO